jgi:hypothetical protein
MCKVLAARLKPQDEFEWFLVYDYLHYSWQIRRWRKAAAALIDTIRQDALRAVLESILDSDVEDCRQLIDGHVDNWFKEDEGTTKSASKSWQGAASMRNISRRRQWQCACPSSIGPKG